MGGGEELITNMDALGCYAKNQKYVYFNAHLSGKNRNYCATAQRPFKIRNNLVMGQLNKSVLFFMDFLIYLKDIYQIFFFYFPQTFGRRSLYIQLLVTVESCKRIGQMMAVVHCCSGATSFGRGTHVHTHTHTSKHTLANAFIYNNTIFPHI